LSSFIGREMVISLINIEVLNRLISDLARRWQIVGSNGTREKFKGS
jgi:hypothetical protein